MSIRDYSESAIKQYIAGSRICELAKQFHCSASMVCKILKESGVAYRKSKTASITREQLYDLYCEKQLSTAEIAIVIGLDRPSIGKLLKKFDIPIRSYRQAGLNRSAQITTQMRKQWLDPTYRQKMCCGYSSVQEKMAHLSQVSTPEVYKRMVANTIIAMAKPEVRQKLVQHAQSLWRKEDYRKAHITAMNRPEVREKLAIARAAQSGRISSIQSKLYSYLDELGVEYYKESERTRIGFYVFDCLVMNGDKKLLIECQGDYWHSLVNAERNDRSKFTYISRYFPEYEIMYVWEHEFYCKDRVLDRLKLKLGIDIETKEFNFSDLIVREIDNIEAKTFLDLYHYLGKDRGGKAFGVFDDDLLVAAIVFSPPLRQNTAGQFGLADGEVRELSRLCIHPSYHKKNFASWFIKRALKQIECKLVIAYADTTVGHDGGIYKASNFELHHTVPADYWYIDISGHVMHKRTLYGRAVKQKMTENEFAETKGYVRKYGGEKLCYIFSR